MMSCNNVVAKHFGRPQYDVRAGRHAADDGNLPWASSPEYPYPALDSRISLQTYVCVASGRLG